MAVITSGKIFSNGEQLTADKMNQMFTSASFDAAGSVDASTLQVLTDGSLSVKDGAITPAKISTGGPSWTTDGEVRFTANASGGIAGDTDNNVLLIKGGNGGGTADGGNIELYGGNHSEENVKSNVIIDGNQIRFRSQGGGTEIMKVQAVGDTGGTTSGALLCNSHPIVMGSTSTDRGAGNTATTGTGALVASWDRGGGQDDATTLKNASNVDHLWYDDATSSGGKAGTWNFCADTTYRNTGNAECRAGLFTNSSDYRLKEDIVEMQDSIDKLKKLKPVNFAWIESGERQDGFIAHEVDEVVPVAVNGTKDAVNSEGKPSYQGVDNGKLVPLLTKCLQEALVKIENLEAKFAALES